MPLLVKYNELTAARRRVYFHLVDATDGFTPETGEAGGQPQISTNGGAWTNTGIGTLTAIGNGRYYADVTQAAVGTVGAGIETRYKSANTAECPGDSVRVVAFNPYDEVALGLTALPTAPAGVANGLMILGYNDVSGNPGGVVIESLDGVALTLNSEVGPPVFITNSLSASGMAVTFTGTIGGDLLGKVLGNSAATLFGTGVIAQTTPTDPLSSTVPGSYATGTAGYALGRIGSGQITTTSVVAQSGDAEVVKGDAYTSVLGRALSWSDASANWPDLTDATGILFEVSDGALIVEGSADAGTSQSVTVELSGANTDALVAGVYDFSVVAEFAGTGVTAGDTDRVTLVQGKLTVLDSEAA